MVLPEKNRRFIIKLSYSEPYLYERVGSGPQRFVAKLSDLDTIAKKLGKTREETLNIVLDLVRKRAERTTKSDVKEKMELILFEPYLFFETSDRSDKENF